jgi:UDP-N-acetylmuramoyl-L-alanyl-D-glutamate--2,6-diaminopimelate ligase
VLLEALTVDVAGPPLRLVAPGNQPSNVEIRRVAIDSRDVIEGTLFCCVRGTARDGHDFATAAVEAGAVALLVDHPLAVDAPQLVTDDVRAAVGPVAAAFHGHPSDDLAVVGVTGTNGKTTVTHMVEAILREHGWSTLVIGTLMERPADQPPTTPDAPALQAMLATARDTGAAAVAMEVSSHALEQGRVRGTAFRAAVFTNLGRDHLDFHGTLDRYFAAKAELFTPAYAALGVVNLDDEHGRELMAAAPIPMVGYSIADIADLVTDVRGSSFTWRGESIRVALAGRFNVSNALAAATCAAELGVPVDVIARGLATIESLRGRFELVDAGQPFTVAVDYAHTPAALAEVLAAARDIAAGGQVIVVFGAGGDKDRGKRPEMGQMAGLGADRVVLTSDNPRSEDPLTIIEDVQTGLPDGIDAIVEPDRRRAIDAALRAAKPGDVVVVAGKGHETYQEIGDERLPFDDAAVVRELLS